MDYVVTFMIYQQYDITNIIKNNNITIKITKKRDL